MATINIFKSNCFLRTIIATLENVEQPTPTTPVVSWLSKIAIRTTVAAALAIAMFIAPLASVGAAEEKLDARTVVDFDKEDGTLQISWTGTVQPGMAKFLRAEFGKYAAISHRVILILDSPGGEVEEGERVIHFLQEVKQMHRLDTVVAWGDTCASMCIPIYLQGQERFGARASLWLFHNVAAKTADGSDKINADSTLRIIRRYYLAAGVNADWVNNKLLIEIKQAEFWQTGQDLITDMTGIITIPLANKIPRGPSNSPPPNATSTAPVREGITSSNPNNDTQSKQ